MPLVQNFLVKRSRRAVENRRRVFGLEPSSYVDRVLERGRSRSFREVLSLLTYLLFLSPRVILSLTWHHLTDRDTPLKRRRIELLAVRLRRVLSADARVIEGYFERRLYSRDLARVPNALEKVLHRTTPLLTVQPRTEADIRAVLRFSYTHRLPVYPRGIASSPFGGGVPTMNGIVLDLSRTMKILDVDVDRQLARIQPGVRWSDLLDHLRPLGLCPVATPTSLFSTVGGWASTGGLGVSGFKYGHFSESITVARIALPNGSLLTLDADDDRLRRFIGTEGQLGIFTELTLRLREATSFSQSLLYNFDHTEAAFGFVDEVVGRKHMPAHVAFYDRVRMHEENLMFREKTGSSEPIVQEREAVLLHFDDPDAADRFLRDRDLVDGKRSDPVAATVLWSNRYFPLKAQRIGPSLLACEVVLALETVPAFVARSRKLARMYGTPLAFEVFVARVADRCDCVVIGSFLCDQAGLGYALRLLLVQLLTALGVQADGRPYGFGIWNTPFAGRLMPRQERAGMFGLKHECDPRSLLNPNKFFTAHRHTRSLTDLLFVPSIHEAALRIVLLVSPALGAVARHTGGETGHAWQVPANGEGKRLIRETEARCTSCGACISVCPAYLVTGEELVSGRAKLRVARAVISSGEISSEEATSTFQCLDCGLCEEVCQTDLPLRACYKILEERVAARYGRPDALIESFLQRVDALPSAALEAYGLSHPVWSPKGPNSSERTGVRA